MKTKHLFAPPAFRSTFATAVAAVLLAAAAPAARGEWVLEFQNASDAVDMGTSYFHYSSDPAIRYGTPMSIESSVTICVWLKNPTPNPQASGYGLDLCDIVGTFYYGGGSGGFGIGMSRSNGKWGFGAQTRHYGGSLNEPTPWTDATDLASDDRWHHLALVYESGVGYRLYLDVGLVSEKACTGGEFTSQRNFSLGAKNWNSFLGRMADVSLFNVALPEERIAEYAKRRLLGNEANEAGLVGYWPLNEGEGATTVLDRVDLDACFAGWTSNNGRSKHNGTIGSTGPVWVQDETFRVPDWDGWKGKRATLILVK